MVCLEAVDVEVFCLAAAPHLSLASVRNWLPRVSSAYFSNVLRTSMFFILNAPHAASLLIFLTSFPYAPAI
jgi:hypothetical protein